MSAVIMRWMSSGVVLRGNGVKIDCAIFEMI